MRLLRLRSPSKPSTRAMKMHKSGADAAASVLKAGVRTRTEDEHGESSYVSLEPLPADLGAGDLDTAGDAKKSVHDNDAPGECAPVARHGLRGGDEYWSGRSTSDDDDDEEEDVILLLSNNSIPCATDDESHYITTHEILLAELSDHKRDFDHGSSASWDVEDGSPAAPFVDYAPLDGEGATRAMGAQAERTAVSTLRENDPCDLAKSSLSKPQQLCSGADVGQIQLSIRSTSRAINGTGHFLEEGNILTRSGDASRCALRGAERTGEALRFAAVPGRVHFGRQLIEHSSGTSSAVSEPDDADKEVRTLTAKTFKSLAHPDFDVVNFGASSESSASERGVGINSCPGLVDIKHGDMSQKLDKTIVALQNSTNRGNKGANQASGKKICALSAGARNPAAFNRVQLMGTVSQGQSGVITLTETLNFRCNVKSGRSEGEKRATRVQRAPGSRSAEDVPDALSGSARRLGQPPSKTKEDASKKAIFASSLIKNVIWKKMQFEQERKMERGEISEQHQASSPYAAQQEGEGRRQSSKASESSSDCTLTNTEDSGDAEDAGSRLETNNFGAETHSEPACEAGIDTKKGTADASNRTLLHSQNSAFRRWKDDDKRDPSPERTPRSEGGGCASRGGKLIKMSHLFVPSIQLLPSERDAGQQLQARDHSVCDDGEKAPQRSDSMLHVADSHNAVKSRSPEIKINIRSVRNNHTEPAAVSKLQTSSMVRNKAASVIRSKDLRCQTMTAALKGESADKVPHFTVRDIRDNKAKLQTPIHQVRDVRKLVKSSYHFLSLDSDSRLPDAKRQSAVKHPSSVSPIVIKCQSVNTNSGGKQSKSRAGAPEGASEAKSESRVVPKWREKTPEEDRKWESHTASRTALEKLQAAVRTMEQLYVFEKNEWKRKIDAPQLSNSHVLSLMANKEHGASEDPPRTQAPVSAAESKNALSLESSQAHSKSSVPKSAKPPKANVHEGARPKEVKPAQESNEEDYLAIPVKSQAGGEQQVSQQATPRPDEHLRQASNATSVPTKARSPETPLSTVYQPQLFCFSPAVAPALEPFQAVQRKLLVDPTTGSCYLVDSPMQPPTKRLFDPETGQYVDVAIPPLPPTTPLPMSVSPLALSPGAYGHTYLMYPGFASTPSVITAQMSLRSEGESACKSPYVDAPFYITTGKCTQPPLGAQQQASPSIPLQPIISISSQQGPHIIAPPSFDGTTMSFVVEHR